MPKMALCIERRHAPTYYNSHAGEAAALPHTSLFWHTPTRLVGRDVCETDETTLQLLPYVVLVRRGAELRDPSQVYCYSRGGAGAEARLHGALSIGLGGHVDAEPPRELGLKGWCTLEACRELHEETGIGFDPADVTWAGRLLCDSAPGVGRYHIGVLALAHITHARSLLVREEEGQVTEGRWLTMVQLTEPGVFGRLEPWSQAAVRWLGSPIADGRGAHV